MKANYFVQPNDVDTQSFPWGTLEWLSEPETTGSKNMVTGFVSVFPGEGHARHIHEGCEEKLYILKGVAKQTIELPEGIIEKEISAGELVHVPADVYHSTMNIGNENLEFIAIYQFSGPEVLLKNDPACTIIPASKK